MTVARRYLISGVVQGVGFRYFTYKIAQKYNLLGYVRNLPDGRVEAYVEGEEEDIKKFFSELRVGPRLSVIDDIKIEEATPRQTYKNFSTE